MFPFTHCGEPGLIIFHELPGVAFFSSTIFFPDVTKKNTYRDPILFHKFGLSSRAECHALPESQLGCRALCIQCWLSINLPSKTVYIRSALSCGWCSLRRGALSMSVLFASHSKIFILGRSVSWLISKEIAFRNLIPLTLRNGCSTDTLAHGLCNAFQMQSFPKVERLFLLMQARKKISAVTANSFSAVVGCAE